MKYHKLMLPILFIALWMTACIPPQTTQIDTNITSATETPLPPTATLPAPTATPAPALLTREVLGDLQYNLPYSQKTIQLSNGSYRVESGAEVLSVRMIEPKALGDLNGDQKDDAAVVLAENTGGSGNFESLVVILDQGGPVQAASVQLGDRQLVNSIVIRAMHIVLDMVVHAPNDPLCCPSLPEQQTYALTKAGLVLVHLTSQTPNGDLREVRIEAPLSGLQVESTVQLKGSITIAPFENTLVYKLVDQAGNTIDQGPLQVAAQEMGGPGTFDAQIDMAKVQPGLVFRLTVSDVSMADGSTLDMDSVELIRK